MQWVKCFLKYISLMMVQRIQETPAMISYMHTIIRAAKTNPGLSWLFYDEQFRLKLVTHPDMEWGKIDNHLWVYCITNFQENKPIEIELPVAKKGGRGDIFALQVGEGVGEEGRAIPRHKLPPSNRTPLGKRLSSRDVTGTTRESAPGAIALGHMCAKDAEKATPFRHARINKVMREENNAMIVDDTSLGN